MAPTIGFLRARKKNYSGIRCEIIFDYTGPASYVTGGDPVSGNDMDLGGVEFVDAGIAVDAAGINPRLLVYDYTNAKMLWFVPNTGAEVAAATNLSGYTVAIQAWGKA